MRATIRQQQENSEILIGWIQLCVVLTFGALYLLSPKTFSEEATFEPVPWALGGYLLFTLLRLALSYSRHLPAWFLGLSVAVDIALLMGLIFSFHLQYAQPASFYLKAPTLLYVFIFIALRALRFEARYVLLTGLAAAAGWLFMIVYVISIDPTDSMITRDYVAYMTSNSILLGAEFDKIVSILVVTAIIALALYRARKLLVRSVVEHAAAEDLSQFFAPEIAEKIIQSEQRITAGQGELRDAAILSVDIRGFTKLAKEMQPDDVIALLTEYQSCMVPAIQNAGGNIDKFLGDGIMATFGAAMQTDTYAADSLRAMEAVLAAADDWNARRRASGRQEIRIGAALTTGPVVFGAVGVQSRLEYTVIGDAANLAAKLEKHTKSENVRALVTPECWAIAISQGYVPKFEPESRPARVVEDVEEPVDMLVFSS